MFFSLSKSLKSLKMDRLNDFFSLLSFSLIADHQVKYETCTQGIIKRKREKHTIQIMFGEKKDVCIFIYFVCLKFKHYVRLRPNVPVNNFSVILGWLPGFSQY